MKQTRPSISIIGLGYVGLCTATTFASRGFRTTGIDVDSSRAEQIRRGIPPFHEPLLEALLRKALRTKLLNATTDLSATSETDTTFITVGTPSQNDGSIDLSQVKNATRALGRAIKEKKDFHLAIIKSTVVPGTTSTTVKPILEESSQKKVGANLGLCVNPEFLKEGTAINDTLNPDKIIIGASDKKSATHLKQIYQKFYGKNLPTVMVTGPETAELVKYASNSFLATKISFINTIANIAQRIPGVDVNQIAEAIGRDPRIGPLFLKAGPGYGGSCFHKDLQAIINFSQQHGYDPVLFHATEETNEQQADRVVELSEKLLGSLEAKKIAVLGIAFKKDTDDVREAASIRVINRLHRKGARIVTYDPMAIPNAKRTLPEEIEFAADSHSAIKGADCCIVMTEWDEFRKLRSKDFVANMRNPNVVDARRIYNPDQFEETNYVGIGYLPPS